MKLLIEEPESAALERHLAADRTLATSRIAVIEVGRATRLANPAAEVRAETERLLESCLLIDLTADLVRAAQGLASASIRSLDAIHLASALRIAPDEFLAYDHRLAMAGAGLGLNVTSPGADASAR